MEKRLKLKTKDTHIIYGTLNMSSKKTQNLIVFVHGLTGHQNEHQFYNAARFFPKKGFDTFRFDLYNGEKGGRRLFECTVKTHASDLETVLRHFRNKYKNIHVAGHSLGGPSIVLADIINVSSVVLWDPSDILGLQDIVEGQERSLKHNKVSDFYIIDWGVEYLLGKDMAKEYKTLRPAKLVENIHKPIKIIAAEYGNLKGAKTYFKSMNEPRELMILKGAGHTFDEEGVEETLFSETLKWIRKYSKD